VKKVLTKLTVIFLIGAFSTIVWGNGVMATEYPIVMKIGHSQPTTHPRHKAFLFFKEIVEKKSPKIKIEIYPAAQLGTEREQMEMLKLGTLQATRGGAFEAASPKLLSLLLPFLFRDLDHVHKVLQGPIGDVLAEVTEENGIKILAWADSGGMRQITNNVRPINAPRDLRGLKIRTPPIDAIVRCMKAFGATPVSVPYADLYMALKTGVADGQENPFVHIYHKKLWEVQKYLSIVNYQYHPDPFFVSLKWWKSLPIDVQAILKDAAVKASAYSDELHEEEAKVARQDLEKKGMVINTVSEENRSLFIEKGKEVYDYYISHGICTKELVDLIQEVK